MGRVASFPDLRFSVGQMLSEGDRVETQLLVQGTHRGTWLGISASGKRLQMWIFTVITLCTAKSSQTGCSWDRSACFSNLELFRIQQNWWGIFRVSKSSHQ